MSVETGKMAPKRIAVVGSDLAAMSAVYNLWKQTEGKADIHIFEEVAGAGLGGKGRSAKLSTGAEVNIDSLVFSTSAHPNLAAFLKELGVATEETQHSVNIENEKVSYRTGSLFVSLVMALVFSPLRAFRLLWAIWTFFIDAWAFIDATEKHKNPKMTIGDFCNKKGYTATLTSGFVVPLVQSVFPCSKDTCLALDAFHTFKAMSMHQMLTFWKRKWYRLTAASVSYTTVVLDTCKPTIHLNTPITKMAQSSTGKWLINQSVGGEFDNLVIASSPTHNQLLVDCGDPGVQKMVKLASNIEKDDQVVIFHGDTKLMPTNKDEWSFVNVKKDHVTYWEKCRQGSKDVDNVFLTILSRNDVNKCEVSKEKYLHEPMVVSRTKPNEKNNALCQDIAQLQGSSGVYLCTAFHPLSTSEDSCKAGLAVANLIQGKDLRIPLTCLDKEELTFAGIVKSTLKSILICFFRWYTKNLITKGSIGVLFPNHDMMFLETNYQKEPMVMLQVRSVKFIPFAILFNDWGWATAMVNGSAMPDNVSLYTHYLCHNLPPKFSRFQRVVSLVRPAPITVFDFYDHVADFFGCIMDKSNTFSVALFKKETDTLEQAQYQKLDRLVDMLDVDENSHVLEIGAGWGSFACRLAERKGCRVTAITTSPVEPIQAMAKEQGLEDKVIGLPWDFIDIPKKFPGKKFDAIVLIEVIEENNGHEYDKYFKILSDHVKDGGQVVIQITCGTYDYGRTAPEVLKDYCYAGGLLPTLADVYNISAKNKLTLQNALCISTNYHYTSQGWLKNFQEKTKAMGANCPFTKDFMNIVQTYLQIIPAMVNSNAVNSYQLVFKKSKYSTERLL